MTSLTFCASSFLLKLRKPNPLDFMLWSTMTVPGAEKDRIVLNSIKRSTKQTRNKKRIYNSRLHKTHQTNTHHVNHFSQFVIVHVDAKVLDVHIGELLGPGSKFSLSLFTWFKWFNAHYFISQHLTIQSLGSFNSVLGCAIYITVPSGYALSITNNLRGQNIKCVP